MESKRLDEIGSAISLYTGAGGMDIGFHKAGFNMLWANDIDKFAAQTYSHLFPNHTVTAGDLLDQKLPKIKKLDLVIGGPPCQGFSVAGRMDPNDPRSKHVWNFMNVVNKYSPRAFVMENVKALGENSRWQELRDSLISEAIKMGYKTKLIVLNAAHYGVPQSRERMFLIGCKQQYVDTPAPVTKSKPLAVGQILKSLPAYGMPGNDSICTAKITPAKNPILRKSPFAGMLFNGQGRPLNLEMPALTLPASMGGNRTPILDQKELTQSATKNSWIIKYHNHLSKGGKPYKEAPDYLRRITVEEAAIIQSFPINMRFFGTQSTKYRQIGNAVPPLLAYHVALAVRKSIT
jgi:DNA (cytosine-5)-methyltransferase 1